MSLIDEQVQFADWVAQRGGDDAQVARKLVAGSVSKERGLAVYQNNLVFALRDALAATFPVLVQLLGDDGFKLTARDYSVSYPSQSGDLNELGRHFAEFISGYEPLQEYPYMVDVAQLEWLWQQSYYAANHTVLSQEDLLAHGTAEWLAARVRYADSVFLFKANHAAASIWLAHQTSGDLSLLRDDALILKAEYVLISRPLWRVNVCVLDEAVFVFLTALQSGASFEEGLSIVDDTGLSFDFVSWLPVLIEAGVWSEMVWSTK